MDADFIFQLARGAGGVTPPPPPPPAGDPVDLTEPLLNKMLQDTGGDFEIYHVTSLANGTGTQGTFPHAITTGDEGKLRVVVFDVCGACVYPRRVDGSVTSIVYQTISPRKNLIVAGETAPAGGFFFFGCLRVIDKNVLIRHITTCAVTDADSWDFKKQYGGAANGFKISSKVIDQKRAIVQNCDILHSHDTTIDMRADAPDSTISAAYVNCLFGEPLPFEGDANMGEARRHHYTCSMARNSQNVLFYGNILLNTSTRLPWLGANTSALWANNYFYNCGGPGARGGAFQMPVLINFDRTGPGKTSIINWIGNHYQGGKSSNPKAIDGNNTAGGFIGYTGNREDNVDFQIYLDDNWFTTNWRDTYTNGDLKGSISTGKLPTPYQAYGATQFRVEKNGTAPDIDDLVTWLAEPSWTIPFDLLPATSVKDHALAYAGAFPAARGGSAARMIDSILDDDATLNQTGLRPAVPVPDEATVAVNVPNGIGTGNFTGDGTHAIVAGYTNDATITPLESWLHGLHMAALGIPSGAANYNPNVAALWTAATAG